MSDELPTVIAPVPAERPIVKVPAAPVEGMIVGIASDVPVAFWKLRKVIVPVEAVKAARLARPEMFKFVPVALVKVRPPILVRPATNKLVVVALVDEALMMLEVPDIYRLVEVIEVAEIVMKLVSVVKLIAPLENCMNCVPVTTVPEE